MTADEVEGGNAGERLNWQELLDEKAGGYALMWREISSAWAQKVRVGQ